MRYSRQEYAVFIAIKFNNLFNQISFVRSHILSSITWYLSHRCMSKSLNCMIKRRNNRPILPSLYIL